MKIIAKVKLLILLNSFLLSSTYNINGVILDSNTEKPLGDVNIYIKDLDIGTTTDQMGYFEMNLPTSTKPPIKLIVQMIGYEKKIISIDLLSDKLDLGQLLLNTKVIELNSVIIQSLKDSTKQISDIYISGSELNENIKGNIANSLTNYPNIGINSFGIVTSKPSLRGLSGDRFLLTKDGLETGDLSQSSIDHVIALDMSEVKEIEIIRGPKSLVFGSNAIGGVINTSLIGNPELKVDKFYKKFLFGRESVNNSIYGNLMLYVPLKSDQINIFYSNRETKNQTSPNGVLSNTQSYTNNYKLGYTNYHNKGFINFAVETFNMEYGIPSASYFHPAVDIILLKNTYQLNVYEDISFYGLKKIDIKYNYIDYIHLEMVKSDIAYDNIYDILDNDDFHVALAKKTENYKLELSGNNHLYGTEYSIKRFKPDGFYLTPTTKEKQISLYGFHKKNIDNYDIDFLSSFRLGYLDVSPGKYNFSNGNANLIDKDIDGNPIKDENGELLSLVDDRYFPSYSFSFGLNKNMEPFELNSWIMHTMRPPRVEELFSDGPHLATYAFEIGNPMLKSEKIYGIENSLSFKSKPTNFSLITFYNYSPYFFEMTKDGDCNDDNWIPGETHPCAGADYIDWGSGQFGWLHKYSAKGNKVVLKGFEIDFKYYLNEYQINYSLSYVEGDNKTTNTPLSYISPMKQILSFSFNKNSNIYKLRISKIHSQDRLGQFEIYTPGAVLTDIIITHNFNRHNFIIQFNNIYDVLYYNHLSRIKSLTPEPGKNLHFIYKLFI